MTEPTSVSMPEEAELHLRCSSRRNCEASSVSQNGGDFHKFLSAVARYEIDHEEISECS